MKFVQIFTPHGIGQLQMNQNRPLTSFGTCLLCTIK